MSSYKRIISLLLTLAIVCSALATGASAMGAENAYSSQLVQDGSVTTQAIDLSGLSCDSFISNAEHRDYINMMLRYYINSDSKLQSALANGLSVVFFFEGGSDNYPGNAYEDKLADIRDQAVVIVVQNNANGKPVVVANHETCSTLPSDPAFAVQIDGTYPIISWNHKSMYGALQIVQEGRSACLYAPDSNKNGYFGVGSGMNIHSRSSSKAGGTNSDGSVWRWSEGCLLIGTGNDSNNYFNTFMRTVAGINYNVWINYSGKQFNTVTANKNMGYCVIDRQLAKSGLGALYNNVALSKITATSDAARKKAEEGLSYADSECTPYPCAVKIKITEDCCPYTQPCNPTTASELGYVSEKLTNKPISKNEILTADALYENTEDNYWYRVTLSDGTKAYLYSTHTTRSSIIYPWVDGGSFPSTITGTTNLQGTVTTGGSRLDTVQALVCRQGTTSPVLRSDLVTVNATTYPLKSSTVDKTMVFGNLSNYGSGYYTLMIDTAFTTYYADNNQLKSAALCDYAATYDFYYGNASHTCNQSTYVYYEASHPHYNCYSCSVCGAVSRKTSETNKINTCDQCRPGKGVLNVSLSSDGTATFTWANTANTTHYNVWLAKKNAEEKWESVEQVFYAENGFQRTFGEGEYRAQLLTYSSEMWEPDGSDWVHTWADDVFFTVSDGTYTIIYNANGGSGAPSSQTETVGTYIDLSWTIPTRFGYSFQGWATDSSASSVVYWPGDVYTDDTSITLYAVWREAEVLSGDTVGQFGEIAYINCPDAGVYYAFIPNTSTEYRIMSESDEDTRVYLYDADGNLLASDDDSGDGTNFLLTYNFTANQTYYIYVRYYSSSLVGTIDFKVSKRYSITYDANGGTGAPETQYHFYDEAVTLSNEEPTRSGYLFVGWSTSNTAVDPDYLPGDIYSGGANLTLYAVWQSDPDYKTTYTISYNANGGSGAPSEQCETIGTSLVLSSEIPTRCGYNFEGWSTSGSASYVSYRPGDVYMGESSVTLYAVWEEADIIVDDNIGHFYELDQIYFPDAGVYTAFIPDANAVYRIEGHNSEDTKVYLYSADGTLLASDDDSGYDGDFLLTYEFTANETYYIYTRFSSNLTTGLLDFEISRRYSVIYDPNGGTGAPETQYHFYDESVSMSTKEPTRPGYFFVGWAESSDATDPQYFLHASFFQNADMVLYAVWKTELSIIDSGTCGIDLVWKLTNDGCLTISGTGAMFDFEEFESPWSEYIFDIKCVVIEQGATSIGEYAFQPCLYLINVQIPDSVSMIGAYAFRDCASLPELVLPSGLATIGTGAFEWCSSLSSITIPAKIGLIGDGAFCRCDSLEQITFEGSAPKFEGDVFASVTAEAYYPVNNSTWTSDVMQDYGGTITWIPYENETLPFTDVPNGSFYYDPVMWAVENGITNGATPTTFNPNGTCLRAHVVTFLHRADGNPEPTSTGNPFTDVKTGDFFYKPVLWAVEKGITNGVSSTAFGSYANCNRAAVVTFLWRAAGSPEPESINNPFVDVKTTDFFYKPVLWAVENGITNGVDATHFGPATDCNRAQVVTFLYRAYNN